MKRDHAVLALALAALSCPGPARADNHMVQSPALMRRAGPSCQPGDLAGSPDAGYGLALGSCAGAAASAPSVESPRHLRRRRP